MTGETSPSIGVHAESGSTTMMRFVAYQVPIRRSAEAVPATSNKRNRLDHGRGFIMGGEGYYRISEPSAGFVTLAGSPRLQSLSRCRGGFAVPGHPRRRVDRVGCEPGHGDLQID